MSDKESPDGIIAAIVVMVGACSLCGLGPAFIVSMWAGINSWLFGLGPVSTLALVLAAAFITYRLWQSWGQLDIARAKAESEEVA